MFFFLTSSRAQGLVEGPIYLRTPALFTGSAITHFNAPCQLLSQWRLFIFIVRQKHLYTLDLSRMRCCQWLSLKICRNSSTCPCPLLLRLSSEIPNSPRSIGARTQAQSLPRKNLLLAGDFDCVDMSRLWRRSVKLWWIGKGWHCQAYHLRLLSILSQMFQLVSMEIANWALAWTVGGIFLAASSCLCFSLSVAVKSLK